MKLGLIEKNKKQNNYERKIIKLGNKFEYLFNFNINYTNQLDIENLIKIKYKFCEEYDEGFIEYKRTLSTYSDKKGKLLRQIYWRLHENYTGVFNNLTNTNTDENKLKCYYVIGLEDDGTPSNLTLTELDQSLNIILNTIANTNINKSYLYLFNEINKSYLLLIKFELELDDVIDYF